MDGYYNYKRNKKTFLITKLPDESELTKEIKISFEDPEKFLKINPSMIVGRLIKGPRMDEDFKIIPHSVVGSASAIEDLQIQKRNTNSLLKYSAKVSSSTLPSIKKDDKIKKPNFDSIDDHKLKSIYQEFQAKKYRNKDKTNDFMKSVPDHITSKLKLQENRLSTFQDEENKVLKLTKKIAKKSKKNVEDLLMNRTDASRLKREIHEIMECKKPFEEKYGNFSWNVSLRRPKNFIGTRHTYLNFGNDINPLWLSIKETIPKYAEIVRKPDQKLDEEFKTLTTNDYLMTTVQTCESVNLNHLQNIKDLEVKSINLSFYLVGRKGFAQS